jgi:hypothetical protein
MDRIGDRPGEGHIAGAQLPTSRPGEANYLTKHGFRRVGGLRRQWGRGLGVGVCCMPKLLFQVGGSRSMVDRTITASLGLVAIWLTKERSIFSSSTGSSFR